MKDNFKFILHYAKKYKFRFAFQFWANLVTSLIVLFFPVIYGSLIDQIFYNRDIIQIGKTIGL